MACRGRHHHDRIWMVIRRYLPRRDVRLPWFGVLHSDRMVLGMASGTLPAVDPKGITFGEREFSYLVRWENISGLAAGELNGNAVLLLQLDRPDAIEVMPLERKTRALKGLARNALLSGAHVVLATTQYRMDLSLLTQAIDRYVREPAARIELSQKFLFAGPSRNQPYD